MDEVLVEVKVLKANVGAALVDREVVVEVLGVVLVLALVVDVEEAEGDKAVDVVVDDFVTCTVVVFVGWTVGEVAVASALLVVVVGFVAPVFASKVGGKPVVEGCI